MKTIKISLQRKAMIGFGLAWLLLLSMCYVAYAQTPAYQKNPRALRVTDGNEVIKWKDSIYYKGEFFKKIDVADSLIKYVTPTQLNVKQQNLKIANIIDFGAKGDSLTISASAIQSAINSSSATYVPKGVYLIDNTLLIPSNHTLIFEEGAIFKANNLLNKHLVRNIDTVNGNVNIKILGGAFNGNNSYQTDSVAVIYFKKVSKSNIENVNIFKGNGKTIDDGYNGALTFSACSFMYVSNVVSINNTGTAFIIMDSDHVNIKGGVFSNNGCTGVGWYNSPYCSAIGVTAENNPTASGISANGFYSTVVGNYSSRNRYNINIGHADNINQYASYSTVSGNTSVNGDYGINVQSGQEYININGNTLHGNGTDFVGNQSTLSFNKFYKGISIKNQNPNPSASINIGTNFNEIPENTHIIMQGGNAMRFTGEDGNADQGGYIFGGSNFIGIGSRLAGTNLDGLSVSNGKVTSSSIKIQGGPSLPTSRPYLEFTTIGSDPLFRNWSITNNDLHTGDFSIRKSILKGGNPVDTGVTFFNIDTLGKTRLKRLELFDADYVTAKFTSEALNTNARNWSISTNSQDYGDFEIRQSSTQGGGTDFNQGAQRFYINRLGKGSFNGTLNIVSNDGTATAAARNQDIGTGWGQYADNFYTSGSPLVVNSGVTSTITNNASATIVTQLPIGVTSFYDSGTSKITPENNGDSYLINVRFTAISSSNSGLADISIDIGGTMNIVAQETISMRKGAGQAQKINIVFDVFSGSTFLANGGLIKLNSIDGNTSIYDISYKVTRTHKAK